MLKRVASVVLVGFLTLNGTSAGAQDQFEDRLRAVAVAGAAKANAAVFLDVQGCGISFSEAIGIADRAAALAPDTGMSLRLGSVGKLYTAAVIHRLAARGTLDLDAPASRYLRPDDAVGVSNREATLRQLLNHTGGVADYYSLPDIRRWDWRAPITPARVLTAIRGRPATGVPGTAYSYSNSGYHLVALVAERATDTSFAELVQAEVITPLDLRETQYNTVAPGGLLHGYVGRRDWWDSAENTGPDSGITATLSDTRKYLRALFVDPGPLNETGRAMVEDPVQTGNPRQQAGAGAEVRTTREGLRFVGHTGDVEGYLSFAYAAPDNDLTMISHISASDKDAFADILRTTAQIVATACGAAE
ncbi:serine hydrolase [Brevundimonas variabilis]|uniref:D-alanyl-D-alanine carboxypeptidase n=1 Tax=Brevundimonas variabilis TaxID=74312 RepID=A0A7W9CF45_9CAUL|nr:D-alanyl-D-alanine carboxypeptidase [Brevundimonas variabilis]